MSHAMVFLTADCPIKPAAAELRLASAINSAIHHILFQKIENVEKHAEASLESVRFNEIQVIRRSVVLCKRSVRGSHEASDRQVIAGRAILPLVVAIGRERHDFVSQLPVREDVCYGPIDNGITFAAALIVIGSRISNT